MTTVDFSSWLDLSVDVWVSIYHRLDNLLDRIFFSSVCSLFRSIPSSIQDDPIRLSQALLLINPSRNNSQTHQFLSLTNSKLYPSSIPELQGKYLCGSSNGWLLTMDYQSHYGDMNLLNPLTRAQISLPSSTTLHSPPPPVESYYYHESDKLLCLGKFTMSRTEDGFIVMAAFPYLPSLRFCQTGDSKWTFLDWQPYRMQDVMYYNGMLYAIDVVGDVFSWDINTYKKRIAGDITSSGLTLRTNLGGCNESPSPSKLYRFYLVESLSGELLMICRLVDSYLCDKFHMSRFRVYKLDERKSFIGLHSLGDQSLFLGSNQSICLSSLDHPEFQADCIYFIDDGGSRFWSSYGVNDVVGVYSLKSRTVQQFYPNHPFWTNCCIWITPSLR